ncbi:carboxymuconolactone decarboxylase family protein [Streptomyces chiangmaiensis]|uniref:Uncharacterized protein n=1 Tax=Streptomyces chiangmaiensis TaxID=766497 RepID=A0ABU7FXT7_9ACTN|nr:hypothetical protein [Streptomyces chiangmaiensis]MED7828951.1 hypothetical protein [Streptomyces chiangmaiensis]
MSRLTVPAPDDVPAGAQSTLDTIGAQFGFVPNMFKTLASNPAVLDVVTGLQAALSRVLDAKPGTPSRWPCRKPTAAITACPCTPT